MKTEQNKQPPAEAGEGAAACWRVIDEFGSPETDWVDGDPVDIEPIDKSHRIQSAYTSQTTATQAAVAAAMRKCTAVIREVGNDWRSRGDMEKYYACDYLADHLTSSIPAEANAALSEYGWQIAQEILEARREGLLDGNDLRAIVTSVIEKGK